MRLLGFIVGVLLSLQALAQTTGYAVNSDDAVNADQLLEVTLETGAFSVVGPLTPALQDVEGLALAPSGLLYGVDSGSNNLVVISTGDASVAIVGAMGFAGDPDFGLTATCSGAMLLVVEGTQSLYEVDTATGGVTAIGAAGSLGDQMTALAHYDGQTFGLAVGGELYLIDETTGGAALIGNTGLPVVDAGLAFGPDGTLWAITSDVPGDDSQIYSIDPLTAAATAVAPTRSGIESLAITPPLCGIATATPVVPTLDRWALLVLITLLLGGALTQRHRFGV